MSVVSYEGDGGFSGDESHSVERTEVTPGSGGGKLIPGLETLLSDLSSDTFIHPLLI